jgi:heme-degrading monooxygenase HmoA
MDKTETQKILSLIDIAYPRFYGAKDIRTKTFVDLWCRMFSGEDYYLVGNALRAHLATSPFPPTVADIKLIIDKLVNPQITEYEAWKIVSHASEGRRDLKKRYSELPEEIKGFMSFKDFRDIVYDDSPEGVMSSNWQRSFKAYQERRKFDRIVGVSRKCDNLTPQDNASPIKALSDQNR